MTPPDPDRLLAECDELSRAARSRRLGELGHRLSRHRSLRAWLAEFMRDDPRAQWALIQLARAARELEPLLELLESPYRSVRLEAAGIVAARVPPGRLDPRLLDQLPADTRTRLVHRLAGRRSTAVVEPLFSHVRDAWPELAPVLLPWCSEFTLRNHIAEFAHAIRDWGRISRAHPRTVLAYVTERLESGGRDPDAWRECAPALDHVAAHAPGEALRLAIRHHPPGTSPQSLPRALRVWTRAVPDALLEWMLVAIDRGTLTAPLPRGLREWPRELEREQLVRLATRLRARPELAGGFLRRLPPSRRTPFWRELISGDPGLTRRLSLSALQAVPTSDRVALGRRLADPFRADPEARRAALRLLPPHEALTAAQPLPDDPAERAATWAAVVSAGVCHGSLSPVLTPLCESSARDTASRRAALAVLADAPTRTFSDRDEPWLRKVAHSCGTSPESARLRARLASRLLAAELDRSAGALLDLALDELEVVVSDDDAHDAWLRRLPRRRARVLFHRLAARIADDFARGDTGVAERVVRSLRPALVDDAEAERLLTEASRSQDRRVARVARRLLFELQPELTLEGPPPELDPTADDRLARYIGRRAPDRLGELLLRHAATPDAVTRLRSVPRLARVLRASTVVELREQLAEGIGDIDLAARVRALQALIRIPGASLRETLHRVDAEPEELRVRLRPLLAAHDDHRGLCDVALHRGAESEGASRGRLLLATMTALPPADVARLIRRVLRERRDEGFTEFPLRALVHLPRPLAAVRFDEALAGPNAHPGARRGILSPALRLLQEEAAWGVLHAFARSPYPHEVRALLGVRPSRMAPAFRERFARLILAATRHPEPPIRRRAFRAALHWSRGTETAFANSAARRVANLQAQDGWKDAVGLLLSLVAVPTTHAAWEELVRDLSLAPAAVHGTPASTRELPAHRRLRHLVDAVTAPSSHAPGPLLVRLARRLDAVRDHELLAARLRVASLDWSDATTGLRSLRRWSGRWEKTDVLDELAPHLSASLGRADAAWTRDAPMIVAAGLVGTEPAAERIAVLILAERARRRLWDDGALSLLERLRNSPQPAVRRAARDI